MDGLAAFAEVYCAAFQLLDRQWLESGASYMEFNKVKEIAGGCVWHLSGQTLITHRTDFMGYQLTVVHLPILAYPGVFLVLPVNSCLPLPFGDTMNATLCLTG
eukprot:759333-Pelagomonas_calceolata.AAC.1